jgi:4-amino-4-deoxy-L-arabinose transferase-like glycosyltransferase
MSRNSLRAIALLSFIEGCLISYWLASFSILSPVRLISLAAILLVSLGFLFLFILLRSDETSNRAIQKILTIKNRNELSLLSLLLALTLGSLILQKELWLSYTSQAAYDRIVPMLVWIMLLGIQAGLALRLPGVERRRNSTDFARILKETAILLGVFLAAWWFISLTRIGLTADGVGLSWGPAGAPISFAQVSVVTLVSLWIAFIHLLLSRWIPPHPRWLAVQNSVIFVGLWLAAVLLWSNQPMSPSHFAPNPVPPNNAYYPSSDAAVFDLSSYHLLTGLGFGDRLIRRPVYVGALALFHSLAGADYDKVILLQLLALGLIPSLIFLVTSNLSNRLGGLLAAGMIILREKNAIQLSGEIVVSHAKLMMSDMAATLGIILVVLIAIRLLKKESPAPWLAVLFGAALGLTVLVRAQALILFPVVALWILLSRRSLKLAGREWAWMLIGLTLVLSPWLWRNWNLTGTLVLDDRGEERLMARNYSSSPVSLPAPRDGETEQKFSARLKGEVVAFITEHPGQVAFFISNHFLHNLATSAVYLAPLYSNASPLDLIRSLPFWGKWDGELPQNSALFLPVNLLILAFGIAVARKKHNLAGWLPLALFLVYSVGNALARSSGWRFSLPMDWVIPVYASIALAYIPSRLNSVDDAPAAAKRDATPPALGAFLLLGLFLAGAAVPLAERLIPARDLESLTQQADETLAQQGILSAPELAHFLEQENAVQLSGLALYPRFYRPNGRIYLDDLPGDEKYLHFWLINKDDFQIVLPMDLPPDHFPQASYVTVIGCRVDAYLQARAVILHETGEQVLLPVSSEIFSCP